MRGAGESGGVETRSACWLCLVTGQFADEHLGGQMSRRGDRADEKRQRLGGCKDLEVGLLARGARAVSLFRMLGGFLQCRSFPCFPPPPVLVALPVTPSVCLSGSGACWWLKGAVNSLRGGVPCHWVGRISAPGGGREALGVRGVGEVDSIGAQLANWVRLVTGQAADQQTWWAHGGEIGQVRVAHSFPACP